MGNLSGESREQNRKDKVTRFRSVTYARQLGLLVNTLGIIPLYDGHTMYFPPAGLPPLFVPLLDCRLSGSILWFRV